MLYFSGHTQTIDLIYYLVYRLRLLILKPSDHLKVIGHRALFRTDAVSSAAASTAIAKNVVEACTKGSERAYRRLGERIKLFETWTAACGGANNLLLGPCLFTAV